MAEPIQIPTFQVVSDRVIYYPVGLNSRLFLARGSSDPGGRFWSLDRRDALVFSTEDLARFYFAREFAAHERRGLEIGW